MTPEYSLIWTRNDANKLRQVRRIIGNEKSFTNSFPSLLFPAQSNSADLSILPKITSKAARKRPKELIEIQHKKVSAQKEYNLKAHSVQNYSKQSEFLTDNYECIFITEPDGVPSSIPASVSLSSDVFDAFQFLSKRGFYLTDGSKFGGYFLVYQGDPAGRHSKWIAVVLESFVEHDSLNSPNVQSINFSRLGNVSSFVRHARLATFVGKNLLVVFRNSLSNEWTCLEFQFSFCSS